jgi:hypothetical protein
MIWNINGSTKRVERFVVQPQGARSGPGAGVVGLKKEQVSFVSSGACTGYFSDADDGKTRIELAKLASWLARPVDHLIVHYTLAGMGLPSGRLTNHGGRRDGNLVIAADGRSFVISRDGVRPLEGDTEGEVKQVQGIALVAAALRRYNPGGVVDIALKDVVAAGEVERYEVLPQQAGLLQLMRSGELRRMNDGYFLIQAPIPRFPAGLAGGHSVKFILGDGVPMPAGSPGHSPVYSETTGECLTGTRCRR